jgi:hypothetical protein
MILRELREIEIGGILMSMWDGRQLALRRVARPGPSQALILDALRLVLPERLATPDRILESGPNRVLTVGAGLGYAGGVMTSQATPPIYKFHIWIHQINPMVWRRILVRSESSIAQLHDIIQIAFG